MSAIAARLRRAEARIRGAPPEAVDRSRWDWYADGCPCGLPPGECREHPRARAGQRPPDGDWRTFLLLGGRGAGKTRTAAEMVRNWVESGEAGRLGLIGATSADYRDTMILGESGIMSISPPWFRPRFEPSKRRLTWPNGAYAICLSSEEPERARGLQFDRIWADELCAWQYPQRMWDLALLCLRIGTSPKAVVTTTPKPLKILARLLAEPTTRHSREATFANKTHLAPEFIDQITAMYSGTRLGQQELLAEILETSEAAWFPAFDPVKHVTPTAEYDPRYPVHLAIDCGVSRHTAAVWFQARQTGQYSHRVTVFGDWHGEGLFSEAAAKAILAKSRELPSQGRDDTIRLDPASNARSGIGPAAFNEFERVLGPRVIGRWPMHRVNDGLDQIALLLETGNLLLHPRATVLKAAFQNYARKVGRGGELLDVPDEVHPHEDAMDALRGGIRDRFPEGRPEQPQLHRVHAARLF